MEAVDRQTASASPKDVFFEFDQMAGEIRDGDTRYLLIRPDVLMGLIKNLEGTAKNEALEAFQKSASENGRASLINYKKQNFTNSDELLTFFCRTAAKLGWGIWTYNAEENGGHSFTVDNSPFAAGYGQSDLPVCAPAGGILRALMDVFFAPGAIINESACAAQGAQCCRFEIKLPPHAGNG